MNGSEKSRKILILICFVGLAITTTTCNEYWFSRLIYKGVLYDTIGGQPVPGVWITLSACEGGDARNYCSRYTVGQNITDANGRFVIHNNGAQSGRYFIVIAAPGRTIQISGYDGVGEGALHGKFAKLYVKARNE